MAPLEACERSGLTSFALSCGAGGWWGRWGRRTSWIQISGSGLLRLLIVLVLLRLAQPKDAPSHRWRWAPAGLSITQPPVLPPAWLLDSVIPVTKRWCNPPQTLWRGTANYFGFSPPAMGVRATKGFICTFKIYPRKLAKKNNNALNIWIASNALYIST